MDTDHVFFDELLKFEHGLLTSQNSRLRPRPESFLTRCHGSLHLGICRLWYSRHQLVCRLKTPDTADTTTRVHTERKHFTQCDLSY